MSGKVKSTDLFQKFPDASGLYIVIVGLQLPNGTGTFYNTGIYRRFVRDS